MTLPAQLRAIADRIEAAELPAHLRGDGPCARCGTFDIPVWFTNNVLWNAVTGQRLYAEDVADGILCINCFVIRADQEGLDPTGWELSAEWPWRKRSADAAEVMRDGSSIEPDSAAVPVAAEEQRPGEVALVVPSPSPAAPDPWQRPYRVKTLQCPECDFRALDAAQGGRRMTTATKAPSLVYCRGCGKPFRRGNEAKAHRPDCIKCASCGHSVVEKISGCSCCESA
jgi:hypothetical protein